jgi:uncharacterized membrane protein YjjP (DUF1212 family)
MFAAFGQDQGARTFLIRVQPEGPNLSRLSRIKEILDRVLDGSLAPGEGASLLRLAAEARSPYSRGLTTAAFAVSSAASAVFFGGGLKETGIAAALGLVTGILAFVAERLPTLERVFPTAAAFLVAALATVAGVVVGNVSVSTVTLAGLVVLLPGLMLVGAMGELATGHLASGTARAAGAFIIFIGIGFGVALGSKVAGHLFGTSPVVLPQGLSDVYTWIALVAAALSFSVLLQADRRDIPMIILAAVVAILASRLGSRLVGTELGPFFGSFGVAVVGWIFLTRTNRPASVVVAPGVLVLVPGSVGFRSITALLENKVEAGIGTAFTALFTAVALVVGLLIANVVLPSRRDI